VTVAYVPGSGSTLVPAVIPPSCVHASKGDPACALLVHHLRERKAGPQIPVTVVQCRTHRRAFTLYRSGTFRTGAWPSHGSRSTARCFRVSIARSPAELDAVFRGRHDVYAVEEGYMPATRPVASSIASTPCRARPT